MTSETLQSHIESVNWKGNITQSFSSSGIESVMASTLRITAIWAMQFEKHDAGNAALTFIREMQVSLQQVSVLLPLCLYKSAAATIRSTFECGLYYTYFRSHPAELTTLIRDDKFYMSKSDIIEYHKIHTPGFNSAQSKLGLLPSLNQWYANISAITHGQRPGDWTTHTSIASIEFNEGVALEALKVIEELKNINSNLFLCTAGKDLWVKFDPDAAIEILKGRSKEEIAAIGI